jgi:hypothetical protein
MEFFTVRFVPGEKSPALSGKWPNFDDYFLKYTERRCSLL